VSNNTSYVSLYFHPLQFAFIFTLVLNFIVGFRFSSLWHTALDGDKLHVNIVCFSEIYNFAIERFLFEVIYSLRPMKSAIIFFQTSFENISHPLLLAACNKF
jgi:hypothetical protein